MIFDDSRQLPTREGTAIGSSDERKMIDLVGADSISTKIQDNPDGSQTMLRTRGGAPEFSTSNRNYSSQQAVRPTFYCIPFDDSFTVDNLASPSETLNPSSYSVSRWGSGASREEVIDGLAKDSAISSLLDHPGNQTWYANSRLAAAPHEFSDIVVSWWGQNNRYTGEGMYTPILTGRLYKKIVYGDVGDIEFFPVSGDWRAIGYTGFVIPSERRTPPFVDMTGSVYATQPGGYFAYGLGGVGTTLEEADWNPVGNFRPIFAPVAPAPAGITIDKMRLWINGHRLDIPLTGVNGRDFISSACIGKRAGVAVLRFFVGENGLPTTLCEIPMSIIRTKIRSGTNSVAAAEITSYANPFSELLLEQDATFTFAKHPAYFNMSGNKAIGIYIGRRPFDFPADEVVGRRWMVRTQLCVEFSIEDSGIIYEVLENNHEPIPSYDGSPLYDTFDILGADYVADVLTVIRASAYGLSGPMTSFNGPIVYIDGGGLYGGDIRCGTFVLEDGRVFVNFSHVDTVDASPPAFTSCATSPDGRYVYLGVLSCWPATLPGSSTADIATAEYEQWFHADSADLASYSAFIPDQGNPKTGGFNLYSSPVFLGPLPPKENIPKDFQS